MSATWLLLAAAPQEGGGAGAQGFGSPFEVNLGLFVWTWIVFIALFFVLKKFAWPAIVQATEERERKIRDQLQDAERLNASAQAALAEGRRAAAEAKAGAQALLAEARSLAEQERATLLERSRREQEEVLARTRREIAAERERAVAELRREAVDLSIAVAGKLIAQRLDTEQDRKLVAEYLDSVEIVH